MIACSLLRFSVELTLRLALNTIVFKTPFFMQTFLVNSKFFMVVVKRTSFILLWIPDKHTHLNLQVNGEKKLYLNHNKNLKIEIWVFSCQEDGDGKETLQYSRMVLCKPGFIHTSPTLRSKQWRKAVFRQRSLCLFLKHSPKAL